MLAPDPSATQGVADLYRALLDAWNARDARAFARLFTADGHSVGFDGSQADTAAEIEAHLSQVFEGHATAAYVARVREVRLLGETAALLRAVVGMVPPGQSDINIAVNSIQSMVAERVAGPTWRVVLLQTTPAAFHGRPDLAEALTRELRQLL